MTFQFQELGFAMMAGEHNNPWPHVQSNSSVSTSGSSTNVQINPEFNPAVSDTDMAVDQNMMSMEEFLRMILSVNHYDSLERLLNGDIGAADETNVVLTWSRKWIRRMITSRRGPSLLSIPIATPWGGIEAHKCLYIIFSYGNPVSENEIYYYFTNQYGDCIDRIYVHPPWKGNRLFGKITFTSSVFPWLIQDFLPK